MLTDLDGLIKAKEANAGEIDNVDPGAYLESQFVNAGIPGRDFTVSGGDRQRTLTLRIGNKSPKVVETEIVLNFKRSADKKPKAYPRKNIYWAIFNAERKSKRWRLRSLSLRAEQLKSKSIKKEGLPDELNDYWFIEKMIFVSRQPVTSSRKAR